MNKFSIRISALLTSIIIGGQFMAQDTFSNKKDSEYTFKTIVRHEATDVQNQNMTGTCWSFSSLSFFESELIRMKKGKIQLSPMYVVRHAYMGKAENYLRMYGTFNFAQGGAFHDIPWAIERYGIVPLEAYKGLNYGTEEHDHEEMEAVLRGMMEALAKKPQGDVLTPAWKGAVRGVLDAYLGVVPENIDEFKFKYEGKEYNPQSFAQFTGLNMDDYVSITSFNHHPFYRQFVLEVQDNWAMRPSYNVPLDEMMQIMEEALKGGYTFAWGADVSEKGFSFRDALAIVPEDISTIKTKGSDNKYFNTAGAEKISNAFLVPGKEKVITQEERQRAFDAQETTDDHGMHVTGLIQDQNGTNYFVVKNSWGKANECDGYFYASSAYVRYKTINILLHKDALSKTMKAKLVIK
jgi:bleomycin hydrolase